MQSVATVDFVAGFVTCLVCTGVFLGTIICLCNRESRRRTHPMKPGTLAMSTAPKTTVIPAVALERHASTLDMMLEDSWTASESARWLNILGSRLFQHDATIGAMQTKIQDSIVDLINSTGKLPPGLGYIRITDLNLGKAPPMIEDIEIKLVPVEQPQNGRGSTDQTQRSTDGLRRTLSSSLCETQITIGFAYNGGATIGVETELVVDWPVESVIGLPISVNTTVSEMSGKIRIRCPPVDHSGEATFGISFMEPPVLRLAIKTEFGEHIKLVNPPKLEEVVNAYIEDTLCTAILAPKEHVIVLSSQKDSGSDDTMGSRAPSIDSLASDNTDVQKRR